MEGLSMVTIVDVPTREEIRIRKHKRDSLRNRMSRGRPGSRRYQRWLNRAFLETLEEVDESDYDDFFSERQSIFSVWFDEANADLVEPLLDTSYDLQEETLGSLDFRQSNVTTFNADVMVARSFKDVNPRMVQLLKHVDFLTALDSKIRQFLVEESSNCCNEQFVCTPFDNYVEFCFHNSFHRLLAHGVCRYYKLSSYSIDSAPGRTTIVNKPKNFTPNCLPPVSVTEYLYSKIITCS